MQSRGIVIVAGGSYKPILRLQFDRGFRCQALLHRVLYTALILGVLHYFMLVKSDWRVPMTFAFLLTVLLGFRAFAMYYQTRRPIMGRP
jgi:DMSO/TMAO reductase YedYZ heme-binding membrane subunit